MMIIETKVFLISLGSNESIEQAIEKLKDEAYEIISYERIDQGGSTHCNQLWLVRVAMPWRKIV